MSARLSQIYPVFGYRARASAAQQLSRPCKMKAAANLIALNPASCMQPHTIKVKLLELYDDPHSEFSAKVKVALYAKGLSWTSLEVPCGSTRSPEFLALNPIGKIPALRVTFDDGRIELLIESEVIVEFLEDQFPQPPLLPAGPLERSRARLISRFHDLYLEPALRRLYPHVAPSAREERVVQEAANAFRALLTDLEGLLLPECSLAVTDSISLADCAYPALFLYADLILPILGRYDVLDWKALPRLRRWREALWTQPAVVAMLVRLRPAAEEWMERQLHS